jgi:hypothetical protein
MSKGLVAFLTGVIAFAAAVLIVTIGAFLLVFFLLKLAEMTDSLGWFPSMAEAGIAYAASVAVIGTLIYRRLRRESRSCVTR